MFDDVNDSLAAREDIFSEAVDLHVPIMPRWLTRDILDQLSKRDTLLRKARARNTADAWARYRGGRNQATNMITRAKRNFFKASFQNSKGNSKSIWKLIRSLGGGRPMRQLEFLKFTEEKIISAAAYVADYFNLHFTTVADKVKQSLLTVNGCNLDKLNFVGERLPSESQFTIRPITADMVKVYLLKMPANKATGIDGISCSLLRLGITEHAPSIVKLINLSLSSGTFPCRWKRARVTALHKAGDMDDVTNRPISVLPVLSKIIERHVHDHLSEYLNVHDLIYKNQSGFRKQYSTETALAYIVDTLLSNLDKNHVNGMVLVDYKKAFDMVDHVTLLSKLEVYKLDRNALLWFESYLTDRAQLVSFKGETSTVRSITAGVPQGSILGPLLFVLFINDLPLHVHTQLDMFADDTTLLASSDCANVEELKNTLSSEVSNVNEWATNNKLPLNCSKTKTMLIDGPRLRKRLSNEGRKLEIELEGSTLEQVENVKLLGL